MAFSKSNIGEIEKMSILLPITTFSNIWSNSFKSIRKFFKIFQFFDTEKIGQFLDKFVNCSTRESYLLKIH